MAAVATGEGLVNCEHCGRSFHGAAFKNHHKICTAERPFKPAPASTAPGGAARGGAGAAASASGVLLDRPCQARSKGAVRPVLHCSVALPIVLASARSTPSLACHLQ
jgi:hypothetical protein